MMNTSFNRLTHLKWIPILILSLTCLTQAKDPKTVRVQGVLIEKQHSLFRLLDEKGQETVVRITAATKIVEDRKNFLREPRLFLPSDLRPGLSLTVKGAPSRDGIIAATTVKFTNKARKMAQVLGSTLVPVDRQLAELAKQDDALRGGVEDIQSSLVETRNGRARVRHTAESAQESAQQAVIEAARAHGRIDQNEARVSDLGERLSLPTQFLHA